MIILRMITLRKLLSHTIQSSDSDKAFQGGSSRIYINVSTSLCMHTSSNLRSRLRIFIYLDVE